MSAEERKESNLRIHQLKAVEALKIVDKACQKNEIDYFLFAGSALGAVRHKGFIPWDDDIDIGLKLPDFNKFKKIISCELVNTHFKWKHTDVDTSFPTLTGRISSINDEPLITIFQIIKLGDGTFQKRSQWLIRKIASPIYQRKVNFKVGKGKKSLKSIISYYISLILACFVSKEAILKIIRWNEIRYEKQNTQHYISLYGKYSMIKESMKSEWVVDTQRVLYEDGNYPIFKNYDAYLKQVYGNYMEYPPEESRIPPHI